MSDGKVKFMSHNSKILHRSSEFELIERFFAPLAGKEGLGLVDDVACLPTRPGYDLVLTVDAVVAGIHFFHSDNPASIARKALGVNISDLAAKGAIPSGFLLTLALPDDWTEIWMEGFADGLRKASEDWKCPLLGGDTVRSPGHLMISITAVGEVVSEKLPKRDSAHPNDVVFVTGTIGDACLGLKIIQSEICDSIKPLWLETLSQSEKMFLKDRYYHPAPRLEFRSVIQSFANASMDISDGLLGDFLKLAHASKLGARLDLEYDLLSSSALKAVQSDSGLFETLLSGGDDYEILFTVSSEKAEACKKMIQSLRLPVRTVGSMGKAGESVEFYRDGMPLTISRKSFSHF